jgi:hypothetical protein
MKLQLTQGPGRIACLAGLLIVLAPMVAHAQALWSGTLAPSRATTWSVAGVEGGIPNRQTNCLTAACNTLFAGTVTAASINSAISSALANTVVRIPAGTYTVSSGINFNANNITLRGAGAASTKLIFTGSSSGCGIFFSAAIRLCSGNTQNIGCTTGCGGPGPDHSAAWTGGYAKGTTNIMLGSVSGLAVGSPIFLDQLSDVADGYPASGDFYVCESGPNCNGNGGNFYARQGRVHVELHKVTAINGLTVTIDPPLHSPDFRASQSPGAWWANAGTALHDSGVEDLTIDFTNQFVGVEFVNALNVWIQGVRLITTSTSGSNAYHVVPLMTFRSTVRDSYFYGPIKQGNTQYAYTPHIGGSLLFENNIIHYPISAISAADPEVGSVYGYNYIDGAHYDSLGIQPHGAGDLYQLYEGNNVGNFFADSIYGPHLMQTLFRNHFDGTAHNSGFSASGSALDLVHGARFANVIGNVLGSTQWNAYQVTTNTDNKNAIFHLGYQGNCSNCGGLTFDNNVQRTLMRWGNWDLVTSTNDTGANDATGTRFLPSEVPSTITSYANPVPASPALPSSFYLSARPDAWWATPWGTPPWPPIGPDVANGTAPNTPSAPTGGHANKIPARLCFENTPPDPAYGSNTPRPLLFDAETCYLSPGVPAAPTNLVVQ